MGNENASAEQLAELRAALLRWHEQFLDPVSPRTLRVVDRLDRLHLIWLAFPMFLAKSGRLFWHLRRGGGLVAAEERAVRLYRQLSGTDPHVARAEVTRIGFQLSVLDARVRAPDADPPGAPRPADPAELEAAAAALIGYYLAGRHSDDALLGEIEAAWVEHEELLEWQRPGARRHRGRRRRAEALAYGRALEAATDRYLAAWRRWLDRPTRPRGPAGAVDR